MSGKKVIDPIVVLKALVKPVVRYCLRKGIRSGQVERLVREVFVDGARQAIEAAQGELSVSKVSVMTGINRVDVTRLMSGESTVEQPHDILNRIIGLWSSGAEYCGADGAVRELTYEGVSSEFAQLVARVSREMSHYPVLFELERIGAVQYRDDRVKLTVAEYVPRGDVAYALALLADDVEDLTAAVEGNSSERFADHSLHLRTVFDNVPAESLTEIRRWILKRGEEFQEQVRAFLAQRDRDLNPELSDGGERSRVIVTSFSYADVIEKVKELKPKKRGRKRCVQE